MKIGAIMTARMKSKRLPGKSLYILEGKPMISYVTDSFKKLGMPYEFVLATSTEAEDATIESFCDSSGIKCYRGSHEDVSGRVMKAALKYGFDAFIMVNGDSPFYDWRIIKEGVDLFLNSECDIVTNTLPKTFPKGFSMEIFKTKVFENSYNKMQDSDFEHVGQYFYRNIEKYNIKSLESKFKLEIINLSVDSSEDMENARIIIKNMKKPHWEYSYKDVYDMYMKIKEDSK